MRLGRIQKGARGPGVFFVMPWIDNYQCVDIRTGIHSGIFSYT